MLQENEKKYLSVLSEKYPNKESASAELISLATELYLPKGTEHFLSDLHGEYEAFSHIRKSASGVIRRKLDMLFADKMSQKEIAELAAIVYYPEQKLAEKSYDDPVYEKIIPSLIELLSTVSAKYTRAKVTLALKVAGEYRRTIYELLYSGTGNVRGEHLYNCVKTVIRIKEAKSFTVAISSAIKRLAVDRVHIVGDIFDRGARPDKILDELMSERAVDIQWGNHDILWMGAASGSPVCIMGVLFNSLSYSNLDFIEIGYGISLRPLAEFATEIYLGTRIEPYYPKGDDGGVAIMRDNARLIAAMRKACAIMMWKLEGEVILRRPEFLMNDRLLLEKISGDSILIKNKEFKLLDFDFPTINKASPYELSARERAITEYLVKAFQSSEKLGRHVNFLYRFGSMYKIYNRNLLFHGCIPLDKHGEFLALDAAGGRRGRELMDFCDSVARDCHFADEGSAKKDFGRDFMWFLWCGKNSPLSGRERITTFERLLIDDEDMHKEPRNPYYKVWDSPTLAEKVLSEFGVGGVRSHIINGHIPVKKGDTPIKAGGKLILIDGGFCHAFLGRTGIAGYTLIYNSEGMRISAHEPFAGKDEAIKNNADIVYDTAVFESERERIKIIQTDEGKKIIDKISDLMLLKEAYEKGEITEKG
ncbi:MAG: fructose-1,6-bisphosphatase [Clostridia bacterium]|nr:fructose-1,6-bisphosphatase [Clostridia bacterium]